VRCSTKPERSSVAEHEHFGGFGDEAVAFLDGLGKDNTRSYFDAHRAIYERDLLAPLRLLVLDVADELRATVAPNLEADPTVGKSLFRINRDTRFSKDKTPYHPWLDAIWWEGHDDARRAPAFIFRIAADHLVVGAGVMAFRDSWRDRFREAVAADTTGERLVAALDAITATHADAEVTQPTRVRVPAPYQAAHPRAELLRLDGLHVSRRLPHPAERSSPRFATWVARELAAFSPVHRWLVDNLT
jgi:uncharacterized protein (TIGR02453 family)